MDAAGLVTIQSRNSVKATIDKLEAALKTAGVTVFARIDHAAGAASVAMELRPTELPIFGNPQAGTPLMQAQQTIGIDLPLKVLAWEDAAGRAELQRSDLAGGAAWARRSGATSGARLDGDSGENGRCGSGVKGGPMADSDAGNVEMRRYWNQVAGPRWVERADLQEARNIEVAELLLREAKPQPGERVLDIGCGPGATSFPFADAVGATGHVTGADISEPMLGLLRRRVAERGVSNITPLLADAQVHPFPPGGFDLAISRFGVMFFADPVAAFRNLYGALRSGGRLCMAVWAPLADNLHWKLPFEIAVRRLGPPKPSDARAPGPLAFSDPAYFRDILEQAGFAAIAVTPTPFNVIGRTPRQEADLAGQIGPPGRLIQEKQADDTVRRALVAEFEAAFAAHTPANGELRLPGTVLLAKAVRK